jgi:hypothetical protein
LLFFEVFFVRPSHHLVLWCRLLKTLSWADTKKSLPPVPRPGPDGIGRSNRRNPQGTPGLLPCPSLRKGYAENAVPLFYHFTPANQEDNSPFFGLLPAYHPWRHDLASAAPIPFYSTPAKIKRRGKYQDFPKKGEFKGASFLFRSSNGLQ